MHRSRNISYSNAAPWRVSGLSFLNRAFSIRSPERSTSTSRLSQNRLRSSLSSAATILLGGFDRQTDLLWLTKFIIVLNALELKKKFEVEDEGASWQRDVREPVNIGSRIYFGVGSGSSKMSRNIEIIRILKVGVLNCFSSFFFRNIRV